MGSTHRWNLTYFDDMLFGTDYDPPEYGLGGLPTDRTLYNYVEQVSYGLLDFVAAEPSSP